MVVFTEELKPCDFAYASSSCLIWANSLLSCWAALSWLVSAVWDAPALGLERAVLFWSALEPWVWTGSMACSSKVAGTWLALAVEPCWEIALPPGRMLPEKAALRDFWRVWYLEMLTEEIENRTMNRAISNVIMSA